MSNDTKTMSSSKKIEVVCAGHFNVLHPGHFRFLDFAASLGNGLCILLKADAEINKRENRKYFSETERASALRNIHCVDKVQIVDDSSLDDYLKQLSPKILVLGHENEASHDGSIKNLVNLAEAKGIQVIFHSGDRNLSYQINLYEDELASPKHDENKRQFMRICSRRGLDLLNIRKKIEDFADLTTLVIGDLIVDEFILCEPLGLSSEAPVVVVKEVEKYHYIGGAGVVASHVSSLGAKVHFISVSGDDYPGKIAKTKLDQAGVANDLLIDQTRPTTFKIRYIANNQKLFRVSKLLDTSVNREIEDRVIKKIWRLAPTLSNIIVSDFVYGVVTSKILDALTAVSMQYKIPIFGDLQCSSQVGNILKFQDFNTIFPTEKEARIAIENKDDGLEFVAQTVFERSNCKNLVIKVGSNGLIAYHVNEKGFKDSEHFPALSSNAVDVSGAGDSVLATMATCISSGMDMMGASALGSIVASCCVETIGNLPISKAKIDARINELEIYK